MERAYLFIELHYYFLRKQTIFMCVFVSLINYYLQHENDRKAIINILVRCISLNFLEGNLRN